MTDQEPPIHLGNPPPPESLQFTRAEPASSPSANRPRCVACKLPLEDTYFHVRGRQVCPACTQRVESFQQAPPAHSLLKSALYGGAAALAGFLLYVAVEFVTGWEIGIIAIVVGYMVGKAIRRASNGLGGRPQQILAVLLTYFAISFSYVGVAIAHDVKAHAAIPMSDAGSMLFPLAWLGVAAPFLSLSNPMNLISLFIIFIGLRQAWQLTGRSNLAITGPYRVADLII